MSLEKTKGRGGWVDGCSTKVNPTGVRGVRVVQGGRDERGYKGDTYLIVSVLTGIGFTSVVDTEEKGV